MFQKDFRVLKWFIVEGLMTNDAYGQALYITVIGRAV